MAFWCFQQLWRSANWLCAEFLILCRILFIASPPRINKLDEERLFNRALLPKNPTGDMLPAASSFSVEFLVFCRFSGRRTNPVAFHTSLSVPVLSLAEPKILPDMCVDSVLASDCQENVWISKSQGYNSVSRRNALLFRSGHRIGSFREAPGGHPKGSIILTWPDGFELLTLRFVLS